MADKKKNEPQDEQKSIMQQIREVNEKEMQQAREAEEKRAAERRAREDAARDAYEKKLRQEHIELMRMKAGVISEEESDIINTAEEEEPKKYTFMQKVESFFYLNKLGICLTIFGLLVVGVFVYDFLNTKESDCSLMFTPYDCDIQYSYDGMDELFTSYIEDYNGDGDVTFDTYWICPPHEMNNMNYEQYQSSATQLYAHFQSGKAVLFMGDDWVYEEYGMDTALEDLRERYPDSKIVTEKGISLYNTNFYELIGVPKESVPEDLYIGIRAMVEGESYSEEMRGNYDIGISVLDKLMEDLVPEE